MQLPNINFAFGKLHEKRVEVLADLFTRCSDLDASLKILKVKIERELLTDPGRMEKAIDDLGNRAHAAQKLFQSHSLYLSRDLSDKVRDTLSTLSDTVTLVATEIGQTDAETLDRRLAVLEKWNNDEAPKFREAMDSLEVEFRSLALRGGSQAVCSCAISQSR